ncbi:hypothetical protein C1H46_008003 [Malus baccata]|uniref:Uncharacterized protein n=1 Tax=Malus baccata TaxID=106549 RepID=A0A540N5R8_MALBA|nr:hypothetical protein C1H46_008003 [Malus baccata]
MPSSSLGSSIWKNQISLKFFKAWLKEWWVTPDQSRLLLSVTEESGSSTEITVVPIRGSPGGSHELPKSLHRLGKAANDKAKKGRERVLDLSEEENEEAEEGDESSSEMI